jgi:hypothetical protein
MNKRIAVALFVMVACAQTGLCDWHHHHGHSSVEAPDPAFDAFMWTSILIVAASATILLLAGPVLVIRNRRIRDLFWMVPCTNALLYLLSITLRPYPGGFVARFQPIGFALEVTAFSLRWRWRSESLFIVSFIVETLIARKEGLHAQS